MRVETWVYRELGRPRLYVRGDVLSDPIGDDAEIDWINTGGGSTEGIAERGFPPLARGVPAWRLRCRGGSPLLHEGHRPARFGAQFYARWPLRASGPLAAPVVCAEAAHGSSASRAGAIGIRARRPRHPLLRRCRSRARSRLLSFWIDVEVPVYRHKTTGALAPFHLLGGHMFRDLTSKSAEEMGNSIERPRARAAGSSSCPSGSTSDYSTAPSTSRSSATSSELSQTGDFLVVIAANEGVPGRPPNRLNVELNYRIEHLASEFPDIKVIRPGDFIKGPGDNPASTTSTAWSTSGCTARSGITPVRRRAPSLGGPRVRWTPAHICGSAAVREYAGRPDACCEGCLSLVRHGVVYIQLADEPRPPRVGALPRAGSGAAPRRSRLSQDDRPAVLGRRPLGHPGSDRRRSPSMTSLRGPRLGRMRRMWIWARTIFARKAPRSRSFINRIALHLSTAGYAPEGQLLEPRIKELVH